MARILDNGLKYCPQCDQYKTADAFGVNRACADRLTVWCKQCRNAKQRQKYNADASLRARKSRQRKDKRATDAEWREKQRQRSATWYAERKDNPDYIEHRRAQERARYAGNPEQAARESRRNQERIESDPEYRAYVNKRHRDYMRRRRANDPEFKARVNKYGREYLRAYVRRRSAVDPAYKARLRNYSARRWAMKRANGGDYDIEDWETMCALAEGCCLACGKEAALTVDHILPVSKGGTSYLTNLQPLCGSCNSGKKDRHIDYRTPQILQWLAE